ncbi:MAG TPA: hypothetical protein VNZ22_12085, partial [Bacillota bacterium]|nr:hypothetical protein [Bacillota bacterium]
MTEDQFRPQRLASGFRVSFGTGLGIALLAWLFVTETLPAGETNTAAPRVVRIDKPGLKNCFQVTPGLYRGAQPTEEGMRHLQELGIKTIVSLRAFHSDKDEVGSLSLQRESIRFNTW